MFESIINFFKGIGKTEKEHGQGKSKEAAKERLQLVLTQDRANVSADFLDLMRQEIIEVIKKYIDVDENAIDVRLANKSNEDGTTGAPALYANIPIIRIKEEVRGIAKPEETKPVEPTKKEEEVKQEPKVEQQEEKKEEPKQEEKKDKQEEKKEEGQEEVKKEEIEEQEKPEIKEEEQTTKANK